MYINITYSKKHFLFCFQNTLYRKEADLQKNRMKPSFILKKVFLWYFDEVFDAYQVEIANKLFKLMKIGLKLFCLELKE